MPVIQREIIINTFAAWTALSALRSGSQVKSRKDIYRLVQAIPFEKVLLGIHPIEQECFNLWHQQSTAILCDTENRLCVGWAAKIINIYLKTAVYVGDLGRPNLRSVIHPPIDGRLWDGIEERFKLTHPEILEMTHTVKSIKSISDYGTYTRIIEGCSMAAKELKCTLFEVEQLWYTTAKLP